MATMRYLVSDVDSAIEFCTSYVGFTVVDRPAPPFAVVMRDDLRLWLSGPGTSAMRPMPAGRGPAPGGWNRLALEVENLPALVATMKADGVDFRNEIVTGPGGSQILAEDGVGNVVELFEAR